MVGFLFIIWIVGVLGFRSVNESYCSLYYLNDLCYFWAFSHHRFKTNAQTPSWLALRLFPPVVSMFLALAWNLRSIFWCDFYHLVEPDFHQSQPVVLAAAKNGPSCIVCTSYLYKYGKYICIFLKGLNFATNESVLVPWIRFSVLSVCLGILCITSRNIGIDWSSVGDRIWPPMFFKEKIFVHVDFSFQIYPLMDHSQNMGLIQMSPLEVVQIRILHGNLHTVRSHLR